MDHSMANGEEATGAPSSSQAISPESFTSPSVEHQVLPERFENQISNGKQTSQAATKNSDFVVTPGGLRQRSLVHKISPKPHKPVNDTENRAHAQAAKAAASSASLTRGKPLFGPRTKPATSTPTSLFLPTPSTDGWVTNSYWDNHTGEPLMYFSTTWTVPPEPKNKEGQTIYIFPGIQNSYWIMQPVLSWGCTPDGSGNAWSVASWYVSRPSGAAYYSGHVPVNVGQTVKGVIAYEFQDTKGKIEWAPQNLVAEGEVGTSCGPAVAGFQSDMYMAWRGVGWDNGIYWTKGARGPSFPSAAPQQKVPDVGTDVGLRWRRMGIICIWCGRGQAVTQASGGRLLIGSSGGHLGSRKYRVQEQVSVLRLRCSRACCIWLGRALGTIRISFLQHIRTKEDGRHNSTYQTSAQATDQR